MTLSLSDKFTIKLIM